MPERSRSILVKTLKILNTAITIMVQVIHKNRRGGNSTKSLLDLTKKPTKASPPKPPVGAKPLLQRSGGPCADSG